MEDVDKQAEQVKRHVGGVFVGLLERGEGGCFGVEESDTRRAAPDQSRPTQRKGVRLRTNREVEQRWQRARWENQAPQPTYQRCA